MYVIALWVKNSSVDVNSKQEVENNLLFPDKNTTYKRCRPSNSQNYHVVAEVMVKVVNRYLLIYYRVLEWTQITRLQIGVALLELLGAALV